jgi:hypothetical protein
VFVDEHPDARCGACHEAFAKTFDDATERWAYTGAVVSGVGASARVFHTGCLLG